MAQSLNLAAVNNLDLSARLSTSASVLFDILGNIKALNDTPEDNVLSIEPGSRGNSDEELRSVGVGTSIGHREGSGGTVLDLEVLVFELLAVDGLSSGSIAIGEVSSLEHELRNHSVEDGALVAEAFFASAQGSEVFGSIGHDVLVELDDDPTSGFASNRHVEEDARVAGVRGIVGVRHVEIIIDRILFKFDLNYVVV